MSNQFKFINTNLNIKVNYPADLPTTELPKKFPLYLRMQDDDISKPYVTDDGKYLLSNGPMFAYVEKAVVAGIEFLSDETGLPFTPCETALFAGMPKAGKPIKVKL